jgi:hypothetical protein
MPRLKPAPLIDGIDLGFRPSTYWPTVAGGGPDGEAPTDRFLPEYEDDEVDIVRVTTATATHDTFVVRARRSPRTGRILYRVRDEYGARWKSPVRASAQPLTMARLVQLLDHATCNEFETAEEGLVVGQIAFGMKFQGKSGDELRGSVDVHSTHYPCLEAYYHARLERLIAEDERRRARAVARAKRAEQRARDEALHVQHTWVQTRGQVRIYWLTPDTPTPFVRPLIVLPAPIPRSPTRGKESETDEGESGKPLE